MGAKKAFSIFVLLGLFGPLASCAPVPAAETVTDVDDVATLETRAVPVGDGAAVLDAAVPDVAPIQARTDVSQDAVLGTDHDAVVEHDAVLDQPIKAQQTTDSPSFPNRNPTAGVQLLESRDDLLEPSTLVKRKATGDTSKSPKGIGKPTKYKKNNVPDKPGLTAHTGSGKYFHYSRASKLGGTDKGPGKGYLRHTSGTHPGRCGPGGQNCFRNKPS